MKKYLAILLAVVMVLGAVACAKTPAAEKRPRLPNSRPLKLPT